MYKTSVRDFNWLGLSSHNEAVQAHLPVVKGVVYDFGCGTRPYEAEILSVADKYIGIDWSNTLHGLHADIVADLNRSLPIPDAVADTIVSFQVLEHISEPERMLSEAFRILKPRANILLTVPFQWWVHEAPHDYYRYTRHGLEYLVSKVGFENIHLEEIGGFWSMWFLKLNYQSTRLIRGPRVLRAMVGFLAVPFWMVNHFVASALDRVWKAPQETMGYVVTARKP